MPAAVIADAIVAAASRRAEVAAAHRAMPSQPASSAAGRVPSSPPT
jgi:hypothetical protein